MTSRRPRPRPPSRRRWRSPWMETQTWTELPSQPSHRPTMQPPAWDSRTSTLSPGTMSSTGAPAVPRQDGGWLPWCRIELGEESISEPILTINATIEKFRLLFT